MALVDAGFLGPPVDLGELILGTSRADLEFLDLAESAFPLGFGDAGDQVVADVGQPCPLGWIRSKERASNTSVLMNARGSEGAVELSRDGRRDAWRIPCRGCGTTSSTRTALGNSGRRVHQTQFQGGDRPSHLVSDGKTSQSTHAMRMTVTGGAEW